MEEIQDELKERLDQEIIGIEKEIQKFEEEIESLQKDVIGLKALLKGKNII